MQRLSAILISGLIVGGAAMAATIQIGGTNGLTQSYITGGGCSTNVAGQTCVTGSTGTFGERSYDAKLFLNTTEGGVFPTPYSGYNRFQPATGTMTGTTAGVDSGVVFSMINDGCSIASSSSPSAPVACDNAAGHLSNNIWMDATPGVSTITIPIGIFDVTDVYTVLNNVWGQPGINDTSVTFTFGPQANSTTGTTVITLDLVNAANNATGGQIRTAVQCSTTTTATCNSLAMGTLAPSTTFGTGLNAVTVKTANLFNTAYNSAPGSTTFSNSAGLQNVDDQEFIFNPLLTNGLYLESIAVTEKVGTNGTSVSALSAITVDSSLPEPSTILLIVSGLGGIVVARRRLRK